MEFEEEFDSGRSGTDEAFESDDQYTAETYDTQQFDESTYENADTAFEPADAAYAEYDAVAGQADDSNSPGFESPGPLDDDLPAMNASEATDPGFFEGVYDQAATYLSDEYNSTDQNVQQAYEGTFDAGYGDVAAQSSFLDDWTFKPTVTTETDDSRDNPQNQDRDRRQREDQEAARRRGETEPEPPITLKDIKENTWDKLFGNDRPAPIPLPPQDPVTRSIERAREVQEARERYKPEPLRKEDLPPSDKQPGDFPIPDQDNRPS